MFLSGQMGVFGILVLCCCNFGQAAALQSPEICYVLDGVLFVYGIVLTVLYCRLKMMSDKPPVQKGSEKEGEGIYTGLSLATQDTYETIKTQKK
ncbi:high affinity immunoglobulin epsilon receptor subunit gamma [Acipenser ruthenus]|uniref:high affinity immunoglobulin epsilon receptor subunit gamma n=1 Tax=Acipenser ruthenus TaxID=7906 RepID=UPI002740F20E|nr:high affinity immunoglobulin epsilon receptor subunit gamma [Acipenser ruthenus]